MLDSVGVNVHLLSLILCNLTVMTAIDATIHGINNTHDEFVSASCLEGMHMCLTTIKSV